MKFIGRHKKALVVIGVIVVIIVGLLLSGRISLRGGGSVETVESPQEVFTNETLELYDVPEETNSAVGDDLGIKTVPTDEQYELTSDDVVEFAINLTTWDTQNETYEEWHERADSLVVYSIQDFPESFVRSVTPNEEEWSEGWTRALTVSGTSPVGDFKGQGAGVIQSWNVYGYQYLFDAEGEPWMGASTDILINIQCAGSELSSCRVLDYSATWPLRFEDERDLGEPFEESELEDVESAVDFSEGHFHDDGTFHTHS